ncbi:MAG TPA: hypothetical protein VLZ74_05365 [Methylocella sp.]|nr:hypothetical protein [Methylocella sp.]
MFRMLLRFLGLCLLATAFVILVIDATHSVSTGTLFVTSLDDSLTAMAPAKFMLARDFIQHRAYPFIWDPVVVEILKLPAWFVSGVIGGIAIRLGARPEPKFGFSSR